MCEISNLRDDPAQIMGLLGELIDHVNVGEAAEGMTAKGHVQGLQSAATIIRWFVNDYPA